MNIKWYLSDLFACGHIRGEIFAREVNRNKSKLGRVDCKSDILISDYYGTDLMVFQRAHNPSLFEKMMLAKENGIKVVYDLDDDFFNLPEDFKEPYDFYSKPEIRDMLTKFMTNADAVTVSTETLAESIKGRVGDTPIFIMENYMDSDMWNMAFAKKQTEPSDKITIGWMASGSHAFDAPLAMPAIKRIMQENKNVHLHLIGWVGWDQMDQEFTKMKSRIVTEPWIDISVLPNHMHTFDIGIAACQSVPYNFAKSSIKLFQYWALGVPVVASCIPDYQKKIIDGKDGLLCDDGDWYDKIKMLVDDEEKRKLMGAQGRFKLLSEYDIKNNVGQWLNTFDMICKI